MTTLDNQDVYIDYDIPLERQIAFLRGRLVSFQLDVFEVLNKELGNQGVEIFRAILRHGYERVGGMVEGVSFKDLAEFALVEEHMSGLQSEIESIDENEFKWSVSKCPIWQGCQQRGMDNTFCDVLEETIIEENSKILGEFREPERMCHGDSKCTFVLKNSYGK